MKHKTSAQSISRSNSSHITELTDGFGELVAILEEGSITAGAQRLGMPRATLSRRLSALEDRLGVRLIHRGTRHLAPTPAGELLFARARVLLEQAAAAETAVRQLDGVPRGLVRFTTPTLPGELLPRMILPFLEAWPEVELELHTSNRHVDLIEEGFDLALRGGQVRDQRLIARPLLREHVLAVASPAYLDRFGRPERPEDLASHHCLLGFAGGLRPEDRWPLLDGGSVQVRGRLRTDAPHLRVGAAVEGRGVALVPARAVAQLLQDGRLEPVLTEHVGHRAALSLVYADRALMPPQVRALIDHVIQFFEDEERFDALRFPQLSAAEPAGLTP